MGAPREPGARRRAHRRDRGRLQRPRAVRLHPPAARAGHDRAVARAGRAAGRWRGDRDPPLHHLLPGGEARALAQALRRARRVDRRPARSLPDRARGRVGDVPQRDAAPAPLVTTRAGVARNHGSPMVPFTADLRRRLQTALGAHERREHPLEGRRHAAVAVVLVDSVVGWLDDYPTRSGYVITPVVLWGGADPTVVPAPDEVLAVYRIGLHALEESEPRFISIPESERPVLQLPLGNDLIHAPTAAILFQLRQVGLLGLAGERVDHLEQPVFAWR